MPDTGREQTWWEEAGVEPIPCCDHCLCGEPGGIWPTRDGHDDTCRHCAMPPATATEQT